MPLGIVRTDLNATGTTYSSGIPVSTPISFGTAITLPKTFGSTVSLPISYGNSVTWLPSALHFGNTINGSSGNGFALENNSGVVLLENGGVLVQE